MPRTEHADVVVIGMGPGGEEVAGRLAEAGLRSVGVERELLGGECPYWGCVPSKMIIRAADLLAEARRIDGVAGRAEVAPDYTPVQRRIREEATDDWDDRVAVERFTGKGGVFVRGSARLTGPGEVVVDGPDGEVRIHADRGVVVATGTGPSVPPVPGLEGTPYWTNREAVKATRQPGSVAVLGGGAIGLELAQAFGRFGSRVTIVEALDSLLALEEPEAGSLIRERLEAEGHQVRTGARLARVAHDGDGFTLHLEEGPPVRAEHLLVATGRHARLTEVGLDTVGLDPSARWLSVDEHMRATDGVWAVGDLTGHGAFTHMAMYQAGIAVDDILGRPNPGADYRATSRVTFTDPEVGAVGMTERQAREAGIGVRTGSAPVARSARGWIHGPGNDGFIKLVADSERGVLVGATSAGPWGGEVLAMLTLAVHAQVPLDTLRRMIYAYPTFHRGVLDALSDLGA